MWKRFKNWLIKKLGGYVAPIKEITVNHYTKEPVVLTQSFHIDNITLHKYPEMVDHLYDSAIQEMTRTLRKNGLVNKQCSESFDTDGQIIKLSMLIIPAIDPVPPSIKDNKEEWEKIIEENKFNDLYDHAQQGGFRKETLYGERPIEYVTYPQYNDSNRHNKIERATNSLYKSYPNITNPLN